MIFEERLNEVQSLMNKKLAARFSYSSDSLPLHDAMRYALRGGKRLRALIALESAQIFRVPESAAIPAAMAVEAMHAYSLVHDDLPCMDNDDLRRGQPTVHKKWDEATAVLAGDALQSLAFELLLNSNLESAHEVSDTAWIKLALGLSVSAGHSGMVKGQAQDMAAENTPAPLSLQEIETLQNNKTGKLIMWSATVGPGLTNDSDLATHDHAKRMTNYGSCLGLAFQIVDDILDVEGDTETVGKAVGKDIVAGKATFVSHLGLGGAKRRAKDLVTEACDVLSVYGSDADCLKDAAQFVISRQM